MDRARKSPSPDHAFIFPFGWLRIVHERSILPVPVAVDWRKTSVWNVFGVKNLGDGNKSVLWAEVKIGAQAPGDVRPDGEEVRGRGQAGKVFRDEEVLRGKCSPMNREQAYNPDRDGQDGGVGARRRVVCGLIPLPIIGGQYDIWARRLGPGGGAETAFVGSARPIRHFQ